MMAESFLFYLFSSIALVSGVMVIRSKNPVHSVLFLILVFCNAAGLLILLHLDFFAMIFLVVYVGAIAVLFLFVVMMLHIKLTEMNENILRYLPVGGIIGLIFLFEVLLVVENDLIPLIDYSTVSFTSQTDSLTNFNKDFLFSWIDFLYYKVKGLFVLLNPIYSYSQYNLDLENIIYGTSSNLSTQSNNLLYFQSFQYTQWPLKIENITNIEALGQILYTYYFYFFILASLILLIAMIGAIVLTLQKTVPLNSEVASPVPLFYSTESKRMKNNEHSEGLFNKVEGQLQSIGNSVKRQEVFEQNTREFTKTIRKLR